MAKSRKLKGSNDPNGTLEVRLKYLSDSNEPCYVWDCPFQAQVRVYGITQNWTMCQSHLAEVLGDWEVFDLIEGEP